MHLRKIVINVNFDFEHRSVQFLWYKYANTGLTTQIHRCGNIKYKFTEMKIQMNKIEH